MKSHSDFIKILKSLETPPPFYDPYIQKKNIHFLEPEMKGVLHEDVIEVKFTSLYANIQVLLFNEGLIDGKWKEDIERVQWFLKNRNRIKTLPSSEYDKWKRHCNSLYMKIESPYVVEYLDLFYSDLILNFLDSIIYIDVDHLFLRDRRPISHLPFDSQTENLKWLWVDGMVSYVTVDSFGMWNFRAIKSTLQTELRSKILQESRNKKLQKIGI